MADLVFHDAALRELLNGPRGPVARDLSRRAVAVESRAKYYATGNAHGYGAGRGPRVQTGNLRSSITWQIGEDSTGLYADVGTNVYYAPFLEFGTSRMPAYPFLRPALPAARI